MNSSPRRAARRSAAFTLIELLVVISIIALLIAILLPALSAARQSAETLQCLSNSRQMAIASVAFATDHRQHVQTSTSDLLWGGNGLPTGAKSGQYELWGDTSRAGRLKDWASALVPYMGGGGSDAFDTADPQVSAGFVCPGDPFIETEGGHKIYNNITDSNQNQPISYATNADVTTYRFPGQNDWSDWAGGQGINPVGGPVVSGNLDEIRSAASTMLYADMGTRAATAGGPVNRSDILMYSASNYVSPGEPGTLEAIYLSGWQTVKMPLAENNGDRHGDRVNVVFADGHGATTGESEWSKVYLSPHKQ